MDSNAGYRILEAVREQNQLLKSLIKMQWELAQVPIGLAQQQRGRPHYGLILQRFIQAYQYKDVFGKEFMDTVVVDALGAFSHPTFGPEFIADWKRIRRFYSQDEQEFMDNLFARAKATV